MRFLKCAIMFRSYALGGNKELLSCHAFNKAMKKHRPFASFCRADLCIDAVALNPAPKKGRIVACFII